ncbi:MAG: DNA translocase FtsK 4TM domain-containing protein, partial [Pyrinomonadaceae bacterium]
MATIQTDVRAKLAAGPRNTRRNEIVAIALIALGALLLLCLVSYDWTDPSRHTAAPGDAVGNWAGVIGAYVSAELFQTIGLAAYLLPVLLLAVAWRRFRTRHIHAPLSRVAGLTTLLLASSALLDLFSVPVPFDSNFRPGGFLGALVAGGLRDGLNTVGASVLLVALAATGVLLATNFSFARAYERAVEAFGHPSDLFRALGQRFRAWRVRRREQAEARAARAERETALGGTAAERSAAQPVTDSGRAASARSKQDGAA